MKKGQLIKHAFQSELMNVKIAYGGEKISFNLYSETVVDENKINSEIQEQPSVYGFLSMLHKRLIRQAQDMKREMEKTYSEVYIKYKEKIDDNTGRPTANELAKEKATASTRYQKSIIAYHAAQHEADIIEVCVRTFEQRQSLIQTLSANIRKER